uniref:Uncharacterized protein n=1 Tax=Oryza meridionalis TaxID=40149 RepID=A0A0E0ES89_9ORYZ
MQSSAAASAPAGRWLRRQHVVAARVADTEVAVALSAGLVEEADGGSATPSLNPGGGSATRAGAQLLSPLFSSHSRFSPRRGARFSPHRRGVGSGQEAGLAAVLAATRARPTCAPRPTSTPPRAHRRPAPHRYGAVLLRLLHAGSMAGADAALLANLDARAAPRLDQASLGGHNAAPTSTSLSSFATARPKLENGTEVGN